VIRAALNDRKVLVELLVAERRAGKRKKEGP
jgi:hypothetical protein